MSMPNLFIVGCMKAGTTALHAYLDQHPDVFMCDPKEPGYFAEPDPTQKTRARYEAMFADGAACRYRGESSTKYTKAPVFDGVPKRIHEACPDARIIYIVRDPVSRIVSQYLFDRRVHGETLPLCSAVARNPRYKAFGDYAVQIEPYQALFGEVLILQNEELSQKPQLVMDKVFDWLDLPNWQISHEERRNNSADFMGRHEWITRQVIRPEFDPLRRIIKTLGAQSLARRIWARLNPPAPSPVTDTEIATLRKELAPWTKAQAKALSPLMDGAALLWKD
jgi:hypothetical protein